MSPRQPTRRELAADLVVLAAFDGHRDRLGHDYGGGQRRNELMRRERDLGGAWVEVDERTVRGIAHVGDYRPSDEELAAAARRLLAPRLRRVELEAYRAATPATRRTVEALKVTLAAFTTRTLAEGLKVVTAGADELDELELEVLLRLNEAVEAVDGERVTGAYFDTVELARLVHRPAGPTLAAPPPAELAEEAPRVVGAGSRLAARGLVERVVPAGRSHYYWRITAAGARRAERLVAAA